MFNIFTKPGTNKEAVLTSNYAYGNKFTISLYRNGFYNEYFSDSWPVSVNIGGFTSINLEPFSYSFGTSWENGPGGKLVNAIQKFTRVTDGTNSLTNIFAGDGLQSNPATDHLTQKILKEGQQLSVSLKFRVFYNNNTNFGNNIIPLAMDDKTKRNGRICRKSEC